MTNLEEKILEKYSIDISQENIFKLYKIDNSDISEEELQTAFETTRKRWNQSINGANEENAERDRARLERADKYEAILKDKKLRKELSQYYSSNANGEKKSTGGGATAGVDFARKYFQLVATTKKIKKQDVEFFLEYYQEERKNKKAIIEMLSKEFKVLGLGKESDYSDEEKENFEQKNKNASSPLIVKNLFQKDTVLYLKKIMRLYEDAKNNQVVKQKYSKLNESLYDFLEMQSFDKKDAFLDYIVEKSKEVYNIRQENGPEYKTLVDLFNNLEKILKEQKDVSDNFEEFKLLVKYPTLTPYMYAFADMKPNTLKGFFKVANEEYVFRNDGDFLLNYFIPLYDNFGISDGGISSVIKKAKKKTKTNKFLNTIDEKLGRKKKRKLSIVAEILYWLAYLPVFLVYLVFEIFKAIFTGLHNLKIPVFIVVLLGVNWLFPKLTEIDNLLALTKILNKDKWYGVLAAFTEVEIENMFDFIMMSLICIITLLLVYVLPALLVSYFVSNFEVDLNKRYDWIGYERTFQNVFKRVREKNETQFGKSKRLYYKDKAKKIVMNILFCVTMLGIIYITPLGFKAFSEATGYFQPSLEQEEAVGDISEQEEFEEESTVFGYLEITASSANVRAGASTDYEVVTVVSQGTVLEMTGNEQTTENGTKWYEVYLDADKTEVGWASEKVLKLQE